jgi:putative oxidoreductase
VLSYPALWEFDCPAAIQSHFFWGAFLLVLLSQGAGRLALDPWLRKRLGSLCEINR